MRKNCIISPSTFASCALGCYYLLLHEKRRKENIRICLPNKNISKTLKTLECLRSHSLVNFVEALQFPAGEKCGIVCKFVPRIYVWLHCRVHHIGYLQNLCQAMKNGQFIRQSPIIASIDLTGHFPQPGPTFLQLDKRMGCWAVCSPCHENFFPF